MGSLESVIDYKSKYSAPSSEPQKENRLTQSELTNLQYLCTSYINFYNLIIVINIKQKVIGRIKINK